MYARFQPVVGALVTALVFLSSTKPLIGNEQQATEKRIVDIGKAWTGVGSQLRATQRALITSDDQWRRVWLSHLGLINETSTDTIPMVDFSKSVVIVIVEPSQARNSGLAINEAFIDDQIIWVDYQQIRDSNEKPSKKPVNVFGFFELPRMGPGNTGLDIVVRRRTQASNGKIRDGDLHQVARFSADALARSDEHPAIPETISNRMLNIEFAHDPGAGNYDGVVGRPNDLWNLVSMGTTAKDFMRYSDTSPSSARLRVSRHDGAWGIEGQFGIFRGYIYDNSRNVDLEVTVLDLPAGDYRAYVYAHGDAPNQNARIEIQVGGDCLEKKATANDGTWRFRQYPFVEGIHYVTFDLQVAAGDDVKFISHRDGSDLSMFNAIQIVPK